MPEALHRSMQKMAQDKVVVNVRTAELRKTATTCARCTATKSDYTRKDEQEMFHPTGARGLECFALPMALTANYSAVRSILRIALRNAISNSICKKKTISRNSTRFAATTGRYVKVNETNVTPVAYCSARHCQQGDKEILAARLSDSSSH